jgi:hypothetical protein
MHSCARLALVASISAAFAIAACGGTVKVDDDSAGSGGDGGTGQASSSSVTTNASSTVSSSSTGIPSVASSSTGPISTSTGPCESCGEALANQQLPASNLCPGVSQQAYDALFACVCASVCAGACTDNLCLGNGITDQCGQCIQNSCFNELNTCANDT